MPDVRVGSHVAHKRRCYVLYAEAPAGTRQRDAIPAFNAYCADRTKGVLFHDHFIGAPGGIGIFWAHSPQVLATLQAPGALVGWRLALHPLVHAADPVRLLYQTDYTMTVYTGRRLRDVALEYEASPYAREIDALAKRPGGS